MATVPLTKRQREIYDFIARELETKGYAPTLDEMRTHFKIRSLGTVFSHLKHLEASGYITRGWNRPRSIELMVRLGTCPTCGQAMEARH